MWILPPRKVPTVRNHSLGPEFQAHLGHHASHTIIDDDQVVHRLLEQHQVRLVLQLFEYRGLIQGTIRLGPGCTDSRALGRVQGTELDPALIDRLGHQATQGIHFFNQVSFPDPANGWVTRHMAQRIDVMR